MRPEKLPFANGRALQPLFQKPSGADWPDEILCAYYGGEFLYTQRIAITNRYKYVFNGFDFDELYDLAEDPDELRNRSEDSGHRKAAAEMRERLYGMMQKYGDPYAGEGQAFRAGEPPSRYGAPRYLFR